MKYFYRREEESTNFETDATNEHELGRIGWDDFRLENWKLDIEEEVYSPPLLPGQP